LANRSDLTVGRGSIREAAGEPAGAVGGQGGVSKRTSGLSKAESDHARSNQAGPPLSATLDGQETAPCFIVRDTNGQSVHFFER
jgi:hypothetical protein